jgi:hypothetical protein
LILRNAARLGVFKYSDPLNPLVVFKYSDPLNPLNPLELEPGTLQ